MFTRYTVAFAFSVGLHVLAVVVAMSPGRARPAETKSRPQARGTIAAFIVAPTEDARFPGLNPLPATGDDVMVGRRLESSALSIGDFKFDVAKIADHAPVLFPFIQPGLALEYFALKPAPDSRDSLRNPLAPPRTRREPSGERPLAMRDAAIQALVDKAWSRRDRWKAFEPIRRLTETHSGNAGNLPNLLQRYGDQNSLQPYADTAIRDPRLWAQLGLAADHVTFIAFIRRYASDHPSTRATTELLFLLDKIAQASRDALEVLLDNDPARDLAWTRRANPAAYQLVAQIRRYYRQQLARRGLISDEAVTVFYEKERLAILQGIVRTTPDGYRANDARFLIGAIYWRQQKMDDALRWWGEMTVDQADSHAIACSQTLTALRTAKARLTAGGVKMDESLHREISRILKNEDGRWLMFSFDRLRQFGHRFDTF